MKYKIKRFKRTSLACPSQWEIELRDGRWMYVRYRHGCLEATVGKDIQEAVDIHLKQGATISKVVGQGDDGFMNNFEMAKHVGLIGQVPKDKEIRFDVPWVRTLAKKLKAWDKK